MTEFLILLGLLVVGLLALYHLAPGIPYLWLIALARRTAGLRLHQVRVDGHDVPYLEGGHGEPLLLLHGFGADKDNWTMVARYLRRHCRVIAPDLPGFGDASRLEQASYGLDVQLERIAAFADALGLESFHLGGNSMGGYLAAMFAKRHPERVRSLWLLAPAGAMGAEPSETLTLLEAGENPLIPRDMAAFDKLAALCFETAPAMPAQFKRPLLARFQRNAAFNEKIFAELFTEPVALEGCIDGLATRTLLVWGDNDRVLHPSGAGILAELLNDVSTVIMPRMGHIPMVERPRDSASDYLRFRGFRA